MSEKRVVMRKLASTAAAVLLACALTVTLSACAPAAQQADSAKDATTTTAADGAVTFTDALGNEVTVANPQRVVACMGSFANAWELAGGTLVGVSDDALQSGAFTIESPDVSTVGDFASVNLESILALNPDFVIMTSGTGGRGGNSSQAGLRDALVDSDIPVAYFEVTDFPDYLELLRTFTSITGREDLYEQNGLAIANAIEDLKASVPADAAPTALVMTTYSGGTRVQDSSTMTGAMLAELGVHNLADENKSLLKDFSLESVIELDPDFIFVIPMGNDAEAAVHNLEEATAANPAWSALSAVRDDNYIVLDPTLFLSKPNEHWADAYRTLYDALYGEQG